MIIRTSPGGVTIQGPCRGKLSSAHVAGQPHKLRLGEEYQVGDKGETRAIMVGAGPVIWETKETLIGFYDVRSADGKLYSVWHNSVQVARTGNLITLVCLGDRQWQIASKMRVEASLDE